MTDESEGDEGAGFSLSIQFIMKIALIVIFIFLALLIVRNLAKVFKT